MKETITPTGHIYETTSLKRHGVSTKLTNKYTHHVLLLDTTESKMDYTTLHAEDTMGSFGWVKYDDIREVIGKKKTLEIIKHVENKIKEKAKTKGLTKG